jgi:hypothetical protein
MKKKVLLFFVFLGLTTDILVSQIKVPPDQRGNRKFRKDGIHNGNLVETLFYNFGEVGWWGRQPSGVWPKGSGHGYMDGITPVVVAEVKDAGGNIIHKDEAGYRELMPISAQGIEQGWQPRPGYSNPNQDNVAMSDNPKSWPSSWPGLDASWDGYWNGYFGKRANADQESFFVMDDNSDDRSNFYPDSTDHTRRGLGLSAIVRGFQWSNIMAQDIIFWLYDIINEGTINYDQIIFGMYVDTGIGGQNSSNQNSASFERVKSSVPGTPYSDITYSWNVTGFGDGGWGPTGFAGYAFLESPGNEYNGIDDNGNGIVDESRMNGIDENHDWDPKIDDVGLDGIPGTGDFGEGDGKPTSGWQKPGVVPGAPLGPVNKYGLIDTGEPGEPGIDKTDLDESDQIGLTAFYSFYIGSGITFVNDDLIWNKMSYHHFDTGLQDGNIAFLFGSGPFTLASGATERFSLGLLFGQDLAALERTKDVVQRIYNNNYNFARPPDKPKLTVVPGDHKVTLYWDNSAETSFDAFLKTNNFEGYKIYKSTDPGFLDSYTITNGYGDLSLSKPVAQFDIADSVQGFFPIAYQGISYYLGDNKGLQHSWTDTDIINGQTYYYAVVSYSPGNAEIGLFPSECTKIVVRNLAGNVTVDQNTAVVTPGTSAAGFVNAKLQTGVNHSSGVGTGLVSVNIIDPAKIKNKSYEVYLNDTVHPDTVEYSLASINGIDTTFLIKDSHFTDGSDFNPLVDGFRLAVANDTVGFDAANSGWIDSSSSLLILGTQLYVPPQGTENYPVSYEIRIGQPDSSWLFSYRSATNFQVWDKYNNVKVRYYFWDTTASNTQGNIIPGDYIIVWQQFGSTWKQVWKFTFVPTPNLPIVMPHNGSVAELKIKTPFKTGDIYKFTTTVPVVDVPKAKTDMNKIAVVPNPYVGAARWEPQRLTSTGRGDRRIYFINLPQEATIRIYTISGDHVRTLYHISSLFDGQEPWDLKSDGQMDIAPGVYIYQVDAPGIGSRVDKFAIIK